MTALAPPPELFNTDMTDQINSLINNMNSQKNAICDAQCMRNKELQKLFNNYTDAKNNLTNGTQNLDEAEKKYYLADKGSIWYSNHKHSQAESTAEKEISKISANLDTYYTDISRNINYYASQLIYRNRMGTLLDDFDDKLKTTTEKVYNLSSKNNIAKRLSKYYEKDLEWGQGAFYYIKLVYWALFFVIIFYSSWGIYKKKYNMHQNQRIIITILCFLFIPLVIQSFFRMILQK